MLIEVRKVVATTDNGEMLRLAELESAQDTISIVVREKDQDNNLIVCCANGSLMASIKDGWTRRISGALPRLCFPDTTTAEFIHYLKNVKHYKINEIQPEEA